MKKESNLKKVWVIGLALALILITAITVYTAKNFKTTAQQEAEASPPPASILTAKVTQQIITDTIPVTCKVTYSDTTALAPTGSLPANAQYTKIAVAEGEILKQGNLLAEINGQPIFAGIGPFSFYRDLKVGDQGPDAKMLNDILTNLGYQYGRSAEEEDTFDDTTLAALGTLYAQFDYAKPSKDDGFKASSFIVLPQEQKVISTPRSTGTVGTTPITQISQNQQNITCASTIGTLSPEVKVGQKLTLHTSDGDKTTNIESVQAPETKNADQAATSTGAAPTNNQNTSTTSKIIAQHLELPDHETAFAADVILSESSGTHPVVPSSALWSKDQQTVVTVLADGKETTVPVRVIYTAQGFNEVEPINGTLTVGSDVKLSTQK